MLLFPSVDAVLFALIEDLDFTITQCVTSNYFSLDYGW